MDVDPKGLEGLEELSDICCNVGVLLQSQTRLPIRGNYVQNVVQQCIFSNFHYYYFCQSFSPFAAALTFLIELQKQASKQQLVTTQYRLEQDLKFFCPYIVQYRLLPYFHYIMSLIMSIICKRFTLKCFTQQPTKVGIYVTLPR